MLVVKNLKSGYGDFEILHGVDLRVDPGEIVAIIGPNGSGKSTLLKSIFGICDIYSGHIFWNEKNITKLPTYEKIYEGISYVPQGKQIFRTLTVKENLEMSAFIMQGKEIVQTNIKDVFKRFPVLKEKQNEYAYTLSGGQQQMLAIGMALVQDPEILLLDEPSLGLSPKAMKILFDKIKEINKDGVSVLIVEQNAKQAVKLANRTYVLEGGRVALEGGKEILKDEKIKNIYFGGW